MKKLIGVIFLSTIAVILACFAGCGTTSVKLDKTELQLKVGENAYLIASVEGDGEVSFVSENEEVAVVDDTGKVVAKKAGTTKIVATESKGNNKAQCIVVVTQPLNGISFVDTEVSIYVGETYDCTVVYDPIDASNKNVTYDSNNLTVAIVNTSGRVSALKSGQVTITATSEEDEKKATIVITVLQHVTGVSLNASTLQLAVEDEFSLIPTVLPNNASNKKVYFSSNADAIASVDVDGMITANAPGQATITVTTEDENKTASCLVTVVKKIESVTLNKNTLTLLKGNSTTLSVTVLPSDAENKAVSYTSSDEDVATVDSEGKIVAIGVGMATITVTSEISVKTDTCTVNVIETILPSMLAVGQKVGLIDGYTYDVTTGDAVAVETSYLSALKTGVATVNVKGANGFDKNYEITVFDLGLTTGTTVDLAKDLSLWNYRNYSGDDSQDISISLQTKVSALINNLTSTTALELDALQYARLQNDGKYRVSTGNMIYLKPEIIASAIDLGYKYLSFYIYVPNLPNDGENSTHFFMYNCNGEGALHYEKSNSDPIISEDNGGRWKRYVINLVDNDKLHDGAGIGWCAYGKYLYLAEVEFTGADISECVSDYITASTTAGKSNDIICEDLIGKMFVATCNTSTLTYGTGGSKETSTGGNDYIKLTKNSYVGTNYYTFNSIRISSDWIQAAKKLGYNVIGIYILKTSDCAESPFEGTAGFIKQSANGKCYGVNSSSAENSQWVTTTGGFVSIDISDFEDGDSLIISSTGSTFAISGLTFRNYDGKNGIAAPSLKYFNYNPNMG